MVTQSARRAINDFLARETTAGFILFAAAIAALIAINSVLAPWYSGFLQIPIELRVGPLDISKPLLLWINDGLMAIFFFLVGLEIKRETLDGELSSLSKATLPIVAAIGGMTLPALIFVAVNWSAPANLNGWAIPAATDIAFALGVLALLGNRVPASLKVLLLAIAIIDDVGAIVIIAVFYTASVSAPALALAVVVGAILLLLNRSGVTRLSPYVLLGLILWVCVLKSGIHATLAGVVTALAVPLKAKDGPSPLEHLEHILHPWVAFIVLPLFAFANAGVSLTGLSLDAILAPLPAGIALGLVLGKQAGVMGFMLAAIGSGWAKRPSGVSWRQLYGLSCLAGIGFTMSLFIGNLAFDHPVEIEAVKLGVLAGSAIAGLIAFMLLLPSNKIAEA